MDVTALEALTGLEWVWTAVYVLVDDLSELSLRSAFERLRTELLQRA